MEKLFDDTLFVQKDRPTKITSQQEERLFIDLAKEIIENRYSDSSEETIIEDLKQLCWNDSGFSRAKDLERSGSGSYEFDGDFIDWLDGMDWKRRDILEENIKLWVKAHNPQPKFVIGDRLNVIEMLNYEKKRGAVVYVTGINYESAYYLIDENPDRKGGTVIIYEVVEERCVVCDV